MASDECPVADPAVRLIHDDDEFLVVAKPAGLVCHPTKGDAYSSLIGRLRVHRQGAPVHLVHRLDRETSGLCLAAKTREAASTLGRLFGSREVRKEYLAIVHGHPAEDEFTVEAPLGRDEASPVAIQDGVRPDGFPAATQARMVRRFVRDGRPFGLLRVQPLTGRKHQIRIHLAHAGFPIVGDKIYGGDPRRYLRFVEGRLTPGDREALILDFHALHAARLSFVWRDRNWDFEAPPEAAFSEFLARAEAGEATAFSSIPLGIAAHQHGRR